MAEDRAINPASMDGDPKERVSAETVDDRLSSGNGKHTPGKDCACEDDQECPHNSAAGAVALGDGVLCPVPYLHSVCTVRLSGDLAPTQTRGRLKIGEAAEYVVGTAVTGFERCVESTLLKMRPPEARPMTCGHSLHNILTVHLLSVSGGSPIWRLTPSEKLEAAKCQKDLGNKLFRANDIQLAFHHYSFATKLMISVALPNFIPPELKLEVDIVKTACYLNLAACQLRTGANSHVITNCTRVLNAHPNNIKALYRRGQAYMRKQEFALAVADFQNVLQLQPGNASAKKDLGTCRTALKRKEANLADGMSKMFNPSPSK